MNNEKTKKYVIGVVTSNSMDKTIVVKRKRKVRHKLYKKYINKTTSYHVRDEQQVASVGDVVSIAACRPMSKTVKWELLDVVEKSSS